MDQEAINDIVKKSVETLYSLRENFDVIDSFFAIFLKEDINKDIYEQKVFDRALDKTVRAIEYGNHRLSEYIIELRSHIPEEVEYE